MPLFALSLHMMAPSHLCLWVDMATSCIALTITVGRDRNCTYASAAQASSLTQFSSMQAYKGYRPLKDASFCCLVSYVITSGAQSLC